MTVGMLVEQLFGHAEDVELLVSEGFDLIFTQFAAHGAQGLGCVGCFEMYGVEECPVLVGQVVEWVFHIIEINSKLLRTLINQLYLLVEKLKLYKVIKVNRECLDLSGLSMVDVSVLVYRGKMMNGVVFTLMYAYSRLENEMFFRGYLSIV